MKLLSYLNENFPGPFDDSYIKSHFKETFGVDVKIEDRFFLFKYDQIEANWKEEITSECRGTILSYVYGEGWDICSRPWSKFHNIGDTKCVINEDNFSDAPNKELWEKLDGSCIQVWYDMFENEWRVSTLGSITTVNVFDNDFTFSELFDRYLPEDIFTQVASPSDTYLFELCTAYNKVVTKYDKPYVFFLGAYGNYTGNYNSSVSNDFLEQYSYIVAENNLPVHLKLPKKVSVDSLGITSLKELLEWVEKESESDQYGINPEGFVLYVDGVPVGKAKNEKYKYLHHVMTGDPLHVKKNLVGLFFTSKIDDCYPDLTEEMQAFVDRLSDKYRSIRQNIDTVYSNIKHLKETRKEYALAVQAQSEDVKMFSAYFFEQLKNECSFVDWLLKDKGSSKVFDSYMDFFKNV